jgi:hypothetical protein
MLIMPLASAFSRVRFKLRESSSIATTLPVGPTLRAKMRV